MIRKNKGFTLIELMIVIIIIGILGFISVSTFIEYSKKQKALREGRTVIERVEPAQPNELKKLNIK